MQDKKNEREKENTKDSSCWFQSRKTVHISWAPPPTLRIGAETVQWLNRFHPGDLCPRSLSSGCPQRHLLSSYWEWCSHGWTKSSELGLVEACIKSLFFSHSLFPRVPFADEESTAQLVPLCVSYSNDCLPATPKRYCSYPLLVLTHFCVCFSNFLYSMAGEQLQPVDQGCFRKQAKPVIHVYCLWLPSQHRTDLQPTVSHSLNYLLFDPLPKTKVSKPNSGSLSALSWFFAPSWPEEALGEERMQGSVLREYKSK